MERDLSYRLRKHVIDRGGPAKDINGNDIGVAWRMMVDAADEIDNYRATLQKIIAADWDSETAAYGKCADLAQEALQKSLEAA